MSFIEKELAISAIEKIDENGGASESGILDDALILRDSALFAIECLPEADVRLVEYGEWLEEPGHIPHCSKCGRYSNDADEGAEFCPFCGVKMKRET